MIAQAKTLNNVREIIQHGAALAGSVFALICGLALMVWLVFHPEVEIVTVAQLVALFGSIGLLTGGWYVFWTTRTIMIAPQVRLAIEQAGDQSTRVAQLEEYIDELESELNTPRGNVTRSILIVNSKGQPFEISEVDWPWFEKFIRGAWEHPNDNQRDNWLHQLRGAHERPQTARDRYDLFRDVLIASGHMAAPHKPVSSLDTVTLAYKITPLPQPSGAGGRA